MKISIYTDGSSKGNPGPGGYGAIMISGNHRREFSGGFRLTTNNRMELLSVISALERIKKAGAEVHIWSDSKYVVDAVEKKWLFEWERRKFKGKKNTDLWKRFLEAYRKHKVKFHWIRGHAGHTENERCDRMAVQASERADLDADEVYEKEISGKKAGRLFE